MTKEQNDKIREFIRGFALATDMDYPEAESHWAAWSVQLPDDERMAIEQQGQDSGFAEGQGWAKFNKAA